MRADVVVLVPVKSFDMAKGRLADSIGAEQRAVLARELAATVIAAAEPLPTYVVCDNAEVGSWALSIGTGVLSVTAPGLNPSMTQALAAAANDGYRRAIISHADLPMARDLTWLAGADQHADVVIVPDRHGTGTNVMSIPIEDRTGFTLRYGLNSALEHRREAERIGWTVTVQPDDDLGWDLDTPEDLEALNGNGRLNTLDKASSDRTADILTAEILATQVDTTQVKEL